MSASFSISQMTASKLLKPSATVYMIGNIKEGHLQNNTAAYCKWEIITNEKNWIVDKGNQCGQTWIAEASRDCKCLWTHPIDIEFRCKSMKGAPKLYIEVYSSNKTTDFYGYGILHIPLQTDKHQMNIPIFRPVGSTKDWISSLFFGGNVRYKNPKFQLLNTKNKFPHRTVSCGSVIVEINIIKNEFPKYVCFD